MSNALNIFFRLVVVFLGLTPVWANPSQDLIPVPSLNSEQEALVLKNLARAHLGASIRSSDWVNLPPIVVDDKETDPNNSPAALLSDDPALSYPLSQGTHRFIVSLSQIENISKFNFFNLSAKGKFSVFTSNVDRPFESNKWKQVQNLKEMTIQAVSADLGNAEAKYVKIEFDITQPGKIACFGIFGLRPATAYTTELKKDVEKRREDVPLEKVINYNYAAYYAKARVAYVSSSADLNKAHKMIDDNPETSFSFAPNDATPTAIIDLGSNRELRRISILNLESASGADIYITDHIPGMKSATSPEGTPAKGPSTPAVSSFWPGKTWLPLLAWGATPPPSTPQTFSLPSDFFEKNKCLHANCVDGRIEIDFSRYQGQFLVIRWIIPPTSTPFVVTEVAAFGNTTLADFDMLPEPEAPGEGPNAPPPLTPPGGGPPVTPTVPVPPLPVVSP